MGKPHIAIVGHMAGERLFGAERSLISLVAGVDRGRFDVSCVLPASNDRYIEAIRRHTGSIHVLDYSWWHSGRPGDPAAIDRIAELFRRLAVDLVHVNTITLIDPLLAARRLGVPCIVHARELIDQDEYLAASLGGDAKAIVARIRDTADFIIANSNATQRLYHADGRSFRLYNGIDADAFDIANAPEPGRLRVGIVSDNQPKKGIEQFQELARLAAQPSPGMEFVVIGPPTDHAERIAQRARQDGLTNLRFAGYVADPVEAMRQLNVVVSLSMVPESFGRTLAEAMAARRPAIAYDHGAAREIVRDGIDGFIVRPFDLMQVLAALQGLADHPARVIAMGEAGRARVKAVFSADGFAAALNDIYRQILMSWRPRPPD